MGRQRSSGDPAQDGFTLVELLVVIGILALLAAILLPVITSARRKAQQSACVSNLHQLSLACSLYAEDDNGLLPPYPSRTISLLGTGGKSCLDDSALLLAALKPYVRSTDVWRCPGDTSHPVADEITACGLPVPDLTSYTYKAFHLIYGGVTPIALDYSGVRLSSSTRVLLEDSWSCARDLGYAQYNHGGRWNRVFLDGHANSFGMDCTGSPLVTETP